MPDIRPALPALLLLCACTAPRLTVTEVGDPFATVYSNVPGVTADNSTCPEGFVPLFPGEPFYRLAPNRTQALLHFRFTDRDGIRSAEVGIENASAIVVFPGRRDCATRPGTATTRSIPSSLSNTPIRPRPAPTSRWAPSSATAAPAAAPSSTSARPTGTDGAEAACSQSVRSRPPARPRTAERPHPRSEAGKSTWIRLPSGSRMNTRTMSSASKGKSLRDVPHASR